MKKTLLLLLIIGLILILASGSLCGCSMRKSFLIAWSGSAKFSLGLSVSSSVVNIYNSIGLFPNAPTWDMR